MENIILKIHLMRSSVTQLYLTICNPMDCNTPGFPVLHHLSEFAQTHVHWISDAIQPYQSLWPPLSPAPNLSQHQSLFQWVNSSHEVAKVLEFSTSASVLPMNTQDWSPLGWTGWISLQSKGLSRVFPTTTVQKHQFFGISFLYTPTLTSIHDYRKNYSFDQTDLSWQSNVSAF